MLNIMQTKPLRNYGIDVTQTSMKPIMEELGLEKSVNELTQAEKEILRYISTLRQAQNAMGDFANTIESPANQLKILRQQFYEMQVAIGNLFVGAFARILPYVNAIIMVIKEVAKSIASFFGIRLQDYNSGVASYADTLEEYSDALDGVGGSAGSASDAIKELKRQTLGFDQINNLTSPTPKSSSGGGGGGAGGGILDGIDQKLLDAIKGYDNGMERVRMKANQIRDKIMETLGFHKELNVETGEWEWKYDGIKVSLKNIWDWFKKLDFPQKVIAVTGVATAFSLIHTWASRISKLTGLNKVFDGIKGLLSPTKNLLTEMGKGIATTKSFTHGFQEGVQNWRVSQGIIDETTGKIKGFSGVIQGVKSAIAGLGEMAVGVYTLSTSFKSLATDGANLANTLGVVGGTFSTVLGGIQVGAIFGPWGAAIGGVVGALVALETAILSVPSALDGEIEATEKSIEATGREIDAILEAKKAREEALESNLAMSNYHQQLLDELGRIVDENGKVKEGYEERAQYIVTTLANAYGVEMSYSDGMVQGWKDQKDAVQKLIDKEKEEIYLQAYHDEAVQSIKDRNALLKKLAKSQGELKSSSEQLDEAEKQYQEDLDYINEHSFPNLFTRINDANTLIKDSSAIDEADENYSNAIENIRKTYEGLWDTYKTENKNQRLMNADTNKNTEEFKRIMSETADETDKKLRESLVKQSQTIDDLSPDILAQWQALGNTSVINYGKEASKLPAEVQNALYEATGIMYVATPEMVDSFAELGKQSEEALTSEVKKLPKHLQTDVIDKLRAKGVKIPEELQKGIDDKKDQPKVDVKTPSKQEVQKKVNDATSGVSGSVNVGVNMPSRWSLQNTLSTLLSGVSGGLNLIFRHNADGGVFANGRWQPIQGYANGGLPSGGQLFMAREAGPELVGKIGRNTAVMNNNQIVDSVKAGVYEAVSAAMGGGIGSVEVYVHTDEGVVVDRINKITRQTGNCPINI